MLNYLNLYFITVNIIFKSEWCCYA